MKKRLRFTTQETFKRTPELLITETPLRIVRNMYVSVSRYPNYDFEYTETMHIVDIDMSTIDISVYDQCRLSITDPDAIHIIDTGFGEVSITQFIDEFIDKFTITSEAIHVVDINFNDTIITVV